MCRICCFFLTVAIHIVRIAIGYRPIFYAELLIYKYMFYNNFAKIFFTMRHYASLVLAIVVCTSVCPSVFHMPVAVNVRVSQ